VEGHQKIDPLPTGEKVGNEIGKLARGERDELITRIKGKRRSVFCGDAHHGKEKKDSPRETGGQSKQPKLKETYGARTLSLVLRFI